MTCLTRILNSASSSESHRFVSSSFRRNLLLKNPTCVSFILSIPVTTLKNPKFFSFLRPFSSQNDPVPRGRVCHYPAAMERPGNPPPESHTPLPEDFVHVPNHSPLYPNSFESTDVAAVDAVEASRTVDSNADGGPDGQDVKKDVTGISIDRTDQNPNHSSPISTELAHAFIVADAAEASTTVDSNANDGSDGQDAKTDLPEISTDGTCQNHNPSPPISPECTDADAAAAVVVEERSNSQNERRDLPEELSKGVVYLECESTAEGGTCSVYLVGTAHVSQESCREVQAVIRHLKPQVVFLELCSNRVAILTPQNLQVPTMNEMIDMWKKKKMNIFGIIYSWFLAKVADKLEVLPGSEFRVAFEEAMSYGAKVILGDRPVHITLRRTWGKMTLWHKTKFLYYIFFQTIFLPSPEDLNKMLKDMDDVDMLTLVIQEMSKAFPTMMETLLYERDLYMSSTLLKVAREHNSVVAVVGKGHLPGIKKHWKQPVEVKDLLEIPTPSSGLSSMKILASVGIAVAGTAIISGVYLAGKVYGIGGSQIV